MNFLQIEFFQALAKTLNFTKTAKILHTTQPNLSKIIANIEDELGVTLFIRSKRDVKLTPAGEVFREEAEKLILSYNNAVTRTRAAEEGIFGTVKLGFIGTAMIYRMPIIVKKFNQMYPNVYLDLTDYAYSPLAEMLLNKSVDIAFIPDLEMEKYRDIYTKQIFTDDMCIVMSKDHPKSHMDIIDLNDFIDENFVMLDPKVALRDNNLMSSICLDHDFIPKVVYEANTLSNLLVTVESNYGVSILAGHMQHFATDNVKFAKIKGYEDSFRIVAAWHRDSHPVVPRLIEVIDAIDFADDVQQ